MKLVVGICSICGGEVVEYTHQSHTSKCTNCGSVKKNNLPIIQMERPRTQETTEELINKMRIKAQNLIKEK